MAVAQQKSAPVVTPPPAQALRFLHHIGPSRSVLLHFDWERLYTSQLFAILEKFAPESVSTTIERIETTCHFPPLEVLESLTFAWKPASGEFGNILSVFMGDLSQEQLTKCAATLDDNNSLSQELQRSYWPEFGTMLIAAKGEEAALEGETSQGNLASSSEWAQLLKGTRDPSTAIWAAGILNDSMQSMVKSVGASAPQSFVLTVSVEERVDILLTLNFDDTSKVASMLSMLAMFKSMLHTQAPTEYAPIVKSIQFAQVDATIVIKLQVEHSVVEDLLRSELP